MKKFLYAAGFVVSVLAFFSFVPANDGASDFCDGWEEGYQQGCEDEMCIRVTPICPIPKVGADTYKSGYGRGYGKAVSDCN